MNRRTSRWGVAALSLVVTIGLAACDDGEPTTTEETTALTVLITDAPGEVAAVWVEIVEMYLQGGEGGRTVLPYEGDGSLIELTELVGVAQPLVEDAPMDAGPYSQLRVVIGDAVLLSMDGGWYVKGDPDLPAPPDGYDPADPEELGELRCPSCSQSGLKVKIAGDEVTIPEGEATMTLDFDVSQSFGHKAGNDGKWIMHPVIHMMVEEGDGGALGSIEGTVVLGTDVEIPECPAETARDLTSFFPLATATTLMDGEDFIERSGATTAEGNFAIGSLEADVYTLGYLAQQDFTGWSLVFTAEASQPTAEVGEGPTDGIVYTISSAVCQASGG